MNLQHWISLRRANQQKELAHVEAGRVGEELFAGMIRKDLTFNRGRIFLGKRIPNPEGGRYEIDAILITHSRIHLIEIKNWSGSVGKYEGCWIQTKRDGEQVTHRDISKLNEQKLHAYKTYLASTGTSLPKNIDEAISYKTIFMNKNIRLSSSLQIDENIVTREQLERFISDNRITVTSKMLTALIELIANKDAEIIASGLMSQMLPSQMNQLIEATSHTRTWDEVQLFGGRIISGDALKLVTGNHIYDLKNNPPGVGFRIQWNRSMLWGLIQAKRGKSLGRLRALHGKIDVSPSDYLLFHCAGQPKPTEFPLCEVEALVKG